jgi:methionyl-tRNA formyltransferase
LNDADAHDNFSTILSDRHTRVSKNKFFRNTRIIDQMRIVFFGTPSFSVPSLKALLQAGEEVIAVVTQPDKRKGRSRTLSAPPAKEIALEKRIDVLQPANIRDPLFIDMLHCMKPEVIAVVAYGKILPAQILKLPSHGCVNVHASLLPKYRGAAPVQWAIIRGERITGITTMLMDEGLDTGDILLQEETEIHDDDDAETLGKRLSDLGARVLMKTLQKIKDGSIQRIPQAGMPSFAPPLKKEDGKIDWLATAREISNFVRGMYPWPCAYCHLNDERLKITRVKVREGSGVSGRIEKADDELLVGTGKDLLSITELQPEGKKPMDVKDFLRGRKLREGAFFDGR